MEETPECQIAIVCEYCEENNVDFSCSCGKRICEKCLGKHKKEHPTHFAFVYTGTSIIVCEKHIGEICKLFCKICCEPVCSVCSQTKHNGHSFSSIDDHLSSQGTLLNVELKKLDMEFKSTYMKLASNNEQRFSEVPAKYSAIREAVEQAGKTLHTKVQETVKKLKMQIEAMEMEHLDCIRDNKMKIDKVLEDIEETKSDIFKKMTDNKKLAMYHVKTYPFENCPDLMDRTLPVFKQSESEFNCFEFLGTLTTSKRATISRPQDETFDRKDDHKMNKSVELLESARQVQKIATVYGYIFDISYTIKEHILVCGTYRIKKSFTIRALDFGGKEIMSIPVQNQPNYISEAKDETIFYTSESKRGVHRIKNGTIETIALDNSWKPRGVACRSSGDVIVAEHNEMKRLGRLSIYTSDGEKKQVLGIGCSEHDLVNPSYVCENANSDICTSDSGKQMVVVFLSAGDLKFMYKGKSDEKEFTSFTPRGLATDCMANILIADYLSHTIHVIDSEGCILRKIVEDINFPTALSVDERKRLLVGQYLDASIQVVEYLNTL
ncbi:E3 ubiquitin-protein ligase TRIM71-like [Saccostrea echinata]|uniref:E3 ubiquitin-protein ligase TRIM71-like n=1 Tax=Saccostrea echinata TaxID=191078 RepID=UPI002A83D0FB|nr:E3 ubiquitin-protein ligase TRIM71-like [Saccostrea echinata]